MNRKNQAMTLRLAAVVLVLFGSLVAACGDSTPTPRPRPTATLTPTPAPTATAVPTPTPTPIPTLTPTSTPTPTPIPFSTAAQPPPTATAIASPSVRDSCDGFLALSSNAEDLFVPFTVTSYRCGSLHVDSTGQGPAAGAMRAAAGDVLKLHFDTPFIPTLIEARLYEGDFVVAYFFRWPEDLPSGAGAVLSVTMMPSSDPHLDLDVAPGRYSLVVHALWDLEAETFFALGLNLVP